MMSYGEALVWVARHEPELPSASGALISAIYGYPMDHVAQDLKSIRDEMSTRVNGWCHDCNQDYCTCHGRSIK